MGLFLKVLKSAGANDADSLEIRLTQKQIAQFGDSQAASKPFLSFIGKVCSLTKDIPLLLCIQSLNEMESASELHCSPSMVGPYARAVILPLACLILSTIAHPAVPLNMHSKL